MLEEPDDSGLDLPDRLGNMGHARMQCGALDFGRKDCVRFRRVYGFFLFQGSFASCAVGIPLWRRQGFGRRVLGASFRFQYVCMKYAYLIVSTHIPKYNLTLCTTI